jgi:hypothetical protein
MVEHKCYVRGADSARHSERGITDPVDLDEQVSPAGPHLPACWKGSQRRRMLGRFGKERFAVKKAPARGPSSLRNHILDSCVDKHAESLLTVQINSTRLSR